MRGFKKTTPNTQVVGFTNDDCHFDVLRKGARGLGLKCDLDELQLLCSGGIVVSAPIGEKPWSLGEYVRQHGGTQNRNKKVWGICIPVGLEEEGHSLTLDSVRVLSITF